MHRFLTSVLFLAMAGMAHAQETTRAITKVAGDVYRWQNNFHYGLVVITDAGVVVADPINTEAATWLKAELAKMTDLPVTHLVYSHSHADHATGGQVFEDTAEIVAHKNAPFTIVGVEVDRRVEDSDSLSVGNKVLEFTYLGEGHGKDLMVTIVRPENIAFVVDAMAPRRLPFRDMPNASIDEWTEQVRVIDTLDFEIMAPGHGKVGGRDSVAEVVTYMETLRSEVLVGLKAGKSVEALQEELVFEEYADWLGYGNWRRDNIAGAARSLREAGAVE